MEGRKGGFRPRGGMNMTPPINVGDEKEVTIEAVGEKGDGLAKINGFVLFVPGVKEGQHVKIRVTKVLRKVGFAEVVGEGTAQPAEAQPAESTEETEETAEQPAESESTEDSENFGEESEQSEESEEADDSEKQ